MGASKLSAVSIRRCLCAGTLLVLSILFRTTVIDPQVVKATGVTWSCGSDLAPTPCFDGSQNLRSGACFHASSIAKEFAPVFCNVTYRFYGIQDGCYNCFDDSVSAATDVITRRNLDESYDSSVSYSEEEGPVPIMDSNRKGTCATVENHISPCWLGATNRQFDSATAETQQKCWTTAYQDSSYSNAHQKADWEQAAQYLLDAWATVQSTSQRLGQTPLWKRSLKSDSSSLAMLRISYQKSFLNRLDAIGAFCHRESRRLQTPTLSASMFLPQKSVWSFARRNKRYVQPSPAEYTVLPETAIGETMAGTSHALFDAGHDSDGAMDTMAKQFAYWEMVAEDFDRQNTMPGLRSGNTVIDERNFSMS